MNFLKYFLLFICIFLSQSLFSQPAIQGELLELSSLAFNKSPEIKRNAYRILDSEAQLQIQKSSFDFNLNSDLTYQKNYYSLLEKDPRNSYLDGILKSNTLNLYALLQKKLRSGQTLKLDLRYDFNHDNYPFNAFGLPLDAAIGDYAQILKFSLVQPLLRGRGKELTMIPEKIAELYIEITRENAAFANSNEILQIGSAYWNYCAAFKGLKIYTENEARVRNVLDMTKELVKADKKPAGDLSQIYADLANQEKLTLVANQNLYNAKLNLGRAVGLNSEQSKLITDPVDDFPTLERSGVTDHLDDAYFTNIALINRKDLHAAKKVLDAVEMQLKLAENNKKPQLDLEPFLFYGNASQGNGRSYTLSTLVNEEGRNVGGGAKLTFSFPLNNNFAEGNFSKAKIALDDQNLVEKNLQRNVEINVSTSVNNLSSSVLVLERARLALEFYTKAFNDEQLKFQNGLTTLLNLILFQERLTSAELQYLQAQEDFANALLRLRHETGTLISEDASGFKISSASYYSLPTNN